MKKHLPTVAVIGRPNTGKSSLFNFLVNAKKSIVDPTEGVTRDIISGTARQEGFPEFTVWDTAGYLESSNILDSLAQDKVQYAIQNADLVVLTVDAQNPHPLDSELALLIKKENKPAIVAANKSDNRAYEEAAAEFYGLGFENMVPISVIQKRGLSILLEKIEELFENNNINVSEYSDPHEVRIAIAGRPNAGKSMLLNTLLGYERMIVSDIPGTTRDATDEIISFKGRTIRITDTAGIKRNAKIKNDIEYYAAVRSAQAIEHAEVVVLLIDAHASADEIARRDKVIADMIVQKKRGMVFALNKWDLIKPQDNTGKKNQDLMKEVERKMRRALPEFYYVPICFISAKDNYKTDKLLETAIKVRDDFYHRVVTGTLNKWLSENLIEYEGECTASRLKIYYGSQVYIAPPRFVFFINKKDHMRKDFPRFLEKRLRLAFEFTGVPITLTFRERGEERH
ncbi:GTP-binding protein [Brevinema andersonii]|uniref:GTPase Der n=1 Tax=Brevinema andersonii TaxID=34097 RepID=A0A1I1D4E2_BREAD|nr:ribosome biogenesis GTPase Der [Brevinema andersonii]SFB69801.1 GTP-binding protein [Brevinema andersonii]